jgi:hypothetical protein
MKKVILSIFKVFVLMLVLAITSCSKDDSEFIEINGKFMYEYPNCDNGGNFELNCTDFIEFIGNSQANILIYGDILYRVNYQLKGNKIELYLENGEKLDLSFIIQNETTLVRTDYNQTWIRE